jgi:CHASE2 domain
VKAFVKSAVWFLGTYVASTLLVTIPPVKSFGLMIQDALQRTYPARNAPLFCKVIEITKAEYKKEFKETSPLEPLTLQAIINNLLLFKPAVLAIDLDTSHPLFASYPPPSDSTALIWGRPGSQSGNSVDPEAIWGQPTIEPARSGITLYSRDLDGRYRVFVRSVPSGSRRLDTLHWATVKAYCDAAREIQPVNGRPQICSLIEQQPNISLQPLRPLFRDYRARPYTLSDVFSSLPIAKSQFPPPPENNMLRDRVVVLGGAYEEHDRHLTPIGPLYGVEIIGELVEAELRGDQVREFPEWARYSFKAIIGLLILGVYVLWGHRPLRALLLSVGLLGALVLTASLAVFYFGSFWIDAGAFCVALVIEHTIESAKDAHERIHKKEQHQAVL